MWIHFKYFTLSEIISLLISSKSWTRFDLEMQTDSGKEREGRRGRERVGEGGRDML